MNAKKLATFSLCTLFGATKLFAADTYVPIDLSHGERVAYMIAYSHLDTQWRWTYPQVIREFIPNTVTENEPYFPKYPHYIFNWTGANRYRFLKEYNPADFAKVRALVAAGRWYPAGSSWEEGDVNVPSSESLIRQLLFGRNFFKKEFGTDSYEYMLPDCFGFPASLPSLLAHCGLKGFSTQKLGWNSANGIPFNVGTWEGPDGESIIAALNPGGYGTQILGDITTSPGLRARLAADGAESGVYADFFYYGTGDTGGAPKETSVAWVELCTKNTNAIRIVSARADQMFRDITDAQKAKLPKYKGDLLLTEHSAGSITSQAYMKRWNHMNEMLADAAERASVAAHVLGAAPYPREKINRAWELVLGDQFHDILPGTCIPKAFEYAWNDENIAMNSFANVLQDAVGAVARGLDTKVEGRPLVVYNPLSVDREDVVLAELDGVVEGQPDLHPGTSVQVFDGAGNPVPTQGLPNETDQQAGKCRFLFLAKVPSIGFSVFSVRPSTNTSASALKVTERSLENDRYRVALNEAGDIASVYDKLAKHELLSAPSRLAFQSEYPETYPAWNMQWKDRVRPPRGYVTGPVKFRVVEKGPVRVAIEVRRESENSIFTQTISLAAGSAGDRVEIANNVDWQSSACSLKATFPLAVTNSLATYNWEMGKIQRGNNEPKKFEVPSHQWFDLTDNSTNYGVSILTDFKYGSDKPSDNELRLTLLYTPGVIQPFFEQRWQDWGKHEFTYALYGHAQDWRSGKSDWQAARLGQPLLAFSTTAHEGKLGRSFGLLKLDSDDIAVRAVKLAEDRDEIIVRLQELTGNGTKGVGINSAGTIGKIDDVNGFETVLKPVDGGAASKLDFKPYQLRSLALTMTSPAKLAPPTCTPVDLPYNLDAFSPAGATNDGAFDDDGRTIPADMIGDVVTSEDITFKIGPRGAGLSNAVVCRGQTIKLPEGTHNRLYLLAAAVNGDTSGEFKVDDHGTVVHVQDWSGYIGQWDNRVFKGELLETSPLVTNALDHIDAGYIKRDPLAWFCSHRHLRDGSDDIYKYSYLFKYRLDLKPDSKTLTLPNNPRIRVFAVTVAQNDNDTTMAARALYDDFTGRRPVEKRGDW